MTTHSKQDWDAWFPSQRPLPSDGTFEIGLVLAGAVSAGSYTAGVVDTLVEALDRWEAAKDRNEADVPRHRVVLRVITGASAGGMVGAIAAVALKSGFPHVQPPTPNGNEAAESAKNPLYKAWVKDIDIARMLGTGDLTGGRVPSLLDCSELDRIAREAVAYQGAPRPARHWLPETLPLLLSVTNLRGVPFHLSHTGATGLGHGMQLHRDHVAFLLTGLGTAGAAVRTDTPGYTLLSGGYAQSAPEWTTLAAAALATGAFPIALKPRGLERWSTDYDARFPGAARDNGNGTVTPLCSALGPKAVYRVLCVDGGAMDNEPFELARVALAGHNGTNPRGGKEAKRAVVMVDPFAETDGLGPETEDVSLVKVVLAMIGAWKNQSRFKPFDLDAALDDDVYSRFLIAPSRNGVHGAPAIASGRLGAFLGFFSEAYRDHDYMLGRQNARDFLRKHFTLPADNPLFRNTGWTARADERFRVNGQRPIIPLLPAPDEDRWIVPPWPAKRFRFTEGDALDRAIVARVDALYEAVKQGLRDRAEAATGDWWSRFGSRVSTEGIIVGVKLPWNLYLRSKILAVLRTEITTAVTEVDEATFPPV